MQNNYANLKWREKNCTVKLILRYVHTKSWMGGWVGGGKSCYKDYLQQSKIQINIILSSDVPHFEHSQNPISPPPFSESTFKIDPPLTGQSF